MHFIVESIRLFFRAMMLAFFILIVGIITLFLKIFKLEPRASLGVLFFLFVRREGFEPS